MQSAISALLFFIIRARELSLVQEIRLNRADLEAVKALISVAGEFANDNDDINGLEVLLTCLKEIISLISDPAQ